MSNYEQLVHQFLADTGEGTNISAILVEVSGVNSISEYLADTSIHDYFTPTHFGASSFLYDWLQPKWLEVLGEARDAEYEEGQKLKKEHDALREEQNQLSLVEQSEQYQDLKAKYNRAGTNFTDKCRAYDTLVQANIKLNKKIAKLKRKNKYLKIVIKHQGF